MMYDDDRDDRFAGFRSRDSWIRGAFVLLFLAVMALVGWLVAFVALFQFVATLVTQSPHPALINFGRSLEAYLQQIVAFVTWNTETRPYPFSGAPAAADDEDFDDDARGRRRATPDDFDDEPFEPEPENDKPSSSPKARKSSGSGKSGKSTKRGKKTANRDDTSDLPPPPDA